jgi:hypothetical protein
MIELSYSALRIKLGLKPLEAGPSNAASTAENNYREQREREKKATEEKAIKDKIEKYVIALFVELRQCI